ncbi:ankyrin-1-like [Trichogramma pretiosum]|uniref:ankyrin-1-like n=1 Tax=Trichogramma pretiosum TaxID=7493 RepID=UPI0006C95284|nr:ankyrin-1-like [Trichogramma pretiosum]
MQVMPPLHLALALNRRKVVKLLLKNGADPNLATAEGVTPLHLVSWSSDRVAKLFFAINYDKGQTLLINARGKNGNTPLHWALSHGHRTMTKWLLERRLIDLESRNCLGSTPLHMISKRTTEDDTMELFFEMLAVVRKKTVNVDARDERGRTPLHYSLKNCHRLSTKTLLMNGADPNATDEEGSTALHLICKRKYSFTHETAEVFFEVNDEIGRTVSIDARDKKGNTPLHIALFCKHEDMIQVLLKNGADPNLANEEGLTPLHIISKRDEDDGSMKLFFEIIDDVQKTVQVDAVDKSGRTPLQWAVASLLPSTIDVLLDNGADLSRLNFVFPTVGHFDKKYKLRNRNRTIWFKLKFAYDTMAVVERLEKRGYELDRSGAMTIMNAFVKHEIFKRTANFDESRYDDEEFVKEAKEIMIKPSLSLYDLIRQRPEESITLNEMHEFLKTSTYYRFTKIYHDACDPYLCEIPTRRFFQKWAPDCLRELMNSANHFNADLWRICLAATGRTEAQSIELIA